MVNETTLCSVAPSEDIYADDTRSTGSKRLTKCTIGDTAGTISGNLFDKEDWPYITLCHPGPSSCWVQ